MTENPQTKDSYLEGRRLESVARKQNSPGAWLKFAAVKAAKGSYALAAMGFLNSGILAEAGGGAPAAAAYERGLAVCLKGGLKEVALILVSRLAALRERAGDFAGAAAAYESFASFCEGAGAFFLAADAGEHAAELRLAAGEELSAYTKPAELWLRNAEYWKDKNAGDEAWSRRRAELYLEGVKK